MAFVGRALKAIDGVCLESCFVHVGGWTLMVSLATGSKYINSKYGVLGVGLLLMNTRGNL